MWLQILVIVNKIVRLTETTIPLLGSITLNLRSLLVVAIKDPSRFTANE